MSILIDVPHQDISEATPQVHMEDDLILPATAAEAETRLSSLTRARAHAVTKPSQATRMRALQLARGIRSYTGSGRSNVSAWRVVSTPGA